MTLTPKPSSQPPFYPCQHLPPPPKSHSCINFFVVFILICDQLGLTRVIRVTLGSELSFGAW